MTGNVGLKNASRPTATAFLTPSSEGELKGVGFVILNAVKDLILRFFAKEAQNDR